MKALFFLVTPCPQITGNSLSRFFSWTPASWMFLCLYAFPTLQNAQQPGSPQALPAARLMRVPTVDVHHIALDLRFDWAKKQAIGSAFITLSPLKVTEQISLDAGMLTIHAIVGGNGSHLKFDYDGSDRNDALQIQLDRKYGPGDTIRLSIDYHSNYHNETDPNNLWGSYGKGLRFFSSSTTEPRKRQQIWSMGEPEGNRYWFPAYDAPNDFRSTDLRLTVDKKLTAISNGVLESRTDNPDGTRTFHWKMVRPHANHQTSVIVGKYVDFQQDVAGTALHSYGYPDEMEAVRASVVRLPDMLRFFAESTGKQYPFPAYTQVFVQEFPWGGGHHIGTATISENMIDDFGTHADFFYLWDGVESQDLAAQWFGNLLSPLDWEHAWLSHSFALYFDCLFTEHKNGHEEMLLWNRQFQHTTYMADWNNGIRRPVVTQRYDSPSTMTQDNYALRGALVLHLLRKHLGEEKWWKAIRSYVQTYANQAVTTDDFRQAVETAAGEPMGWFFDQWLYKMGHPVFEASQRYDPRKKQLSLVLQQVQQPDSSSAYPQVTFFQGKMEIEIDGRISTVWIAPKAENTFVFDLPKAPKIVQVDVENTWIKELRFAKTFEALMYQFQNGQDILGRRAAMLELTNIYKKTSTADIDKDNIRKAFRRVILGDAYWRLRYSAMLILQGMVADKPLDKTTVSMLKQVAKLEKSWNRTAAISFLGASQKAEHAAFYRQFLNDESDRVVNAAANALGKSKASGAYEALVKLKDKPSWKNQSLISALNGLKELGDPRGAELALQALKDPDAAPRWTLATPVWDFRIAAAETLVALGKGSEGFPIVLARFQKALAENDVNDVFSNLLLVATLADPRGQEVFDQAKERYKGNPEAMTALEGYLLQWKEGLK